MGHSNGIISAPVNTADVMLTIGENSHDVGTLCSAATKINKWARNKPEATGTMIPLTDADRKANNFALRPPTTYTSVQNYVNAANKVNGIELSDWTYDCPKDGDWFRLTDFDNYRADSASPFPTMMQGDYIFGTATNGTKVLNITLAAGYEGVTGSTDYIRLADMNMSGAKYSDWYVGVMIMTNSSTYYLATSTSTLSNSVFIQFNTDNGMLVPAEGAHTAYVFLANKSFSVCSSGSIAVSGLELVPLTKNPVTINLLTSESALLVTCAMQSQKIAVTVTNKNTSSVVITPVEFQRSTTASDSNTTVVTPIETLSAFTVAAGTAANPTVVSQTYRAPVVGSSGYIRLVYTYKIGSGSTSANQTTAWSALVSAT